MRKTLDGSALATVSILCLVWGFQQVAIKSIALEVEPVLQAAFRSGISALLVAGFLYFRGRTSGFDKKTIRPGMLTGALFALEFFLVAQGLRFTSASHMAVLLYTAPIFAALGLHLYEPEERLSRSQWCGMFLAFFGIFLIFAGRPNETTISSAGILLGDAFGLLAGAVWGATTVVVRCTSLANARPAHTLLYQLSGGFVLLVPMAFMLGQTNFQPGTLVYANLFFQSVVISFISYLVWFSLLRRYEAARLGVLTLLTPVFGVFLGVWLLGEPLRINFLTGTLLVLLGVVWVMGSDQVRLSRR